MLSSTSPNHKQTAQAAHQSGINQRGQKLLVVTSTHSEPMTFFRIWHKRGCMNSWSLFWGNGRMARASLTLLWSGLIDWLSHINMIQSSISQIVTREACVSINVFVCRAHQMCWSETSVPQTNFPSHAVHKSVTWLEHILSCLAHINLFLLIIFMKFLFGSSLCPDTWQQTSSKWIVFVQERFYASPVVPYIVGWIFIFTVSYSCEGHSVHSAVKLWFFIHGPRNRSYFCLCSAFSGDELATI